MDERPSLSCLRALSLILDLANGFDEDKSARTAAFALRLSEEAASSPSERESAWFAAMLRHIGCTAFASTEATLAEDDITLRRRLQQGGSSSPVEILSALREANPSASAFLSALWRVTSSEDLRGRWYREACEAARLLSAALGLPDPVVLALDQIFERWDGQGGPSALGGQDLDPSGRVAQVAHVTVVQWSLGGTLRARAALSALSGSLLEPRLAALAASLLPEIESLDLARDPPGEISIPLDDLAVAFGDFVDLGTPTGTGHARRTAELSAAAARLLSLPADEIVVLSRAASLHDLGEVALPSSIREKPRALTRSERERIRLHPYLTERALANAPGLANAAPIASAHHERLDGLGYHRGSSARDLPRSSRILAVADIFSALTSPRPYRLAHPPAEARRILADLASRGEIDADCTNAVLSAAGQPPTQAPTLVLDLTPREIEVLRELALGHTNKEIAASLGISPRTVQNHTLHIYEKLHVSTRAGAALLATRAGLL